MRESLEDQLDRFLHIFCKGSFRDVLDQKKFEKKGKKVFYDELNLLKKFNDPTPIPHSFTVLADYMIETRNYFMDKKIGAVYQYKLFLFNNAQN